MNTKKRPLAALFGVGFFALGIVGTLATPSAPGFVDEPAQIVKYYTDNGGSLLAANTMYLLAGAVLLAFAGALYGASRRAEGGDGRIARMGFGGAVAGAGMVLASASTDSVAALRVEEQDKVDPQVATVLWDLSSILYGLAAPMAFAVLVLATATLALRNVLLPKWFGAISIVLGVALLIPPISFIAVIVFNFWVLLTSLMLFLRPEPGARQEAAAAPAA